MAHNLNIIGGKASMFYAGETPWHGLGTRLDNPATAVQALKEASLDYEVRKAPLYFGETLSGIKQFKGKVCTYRPDTNDQLGIVGDNYRIVQNTEAFNFFDVLVGEGQAIYHTAGALGNGERIWILAKLPKDIIVNGSDKVEQYLVLTNSHDGLSSLKVYFAPIRVVCQNTLTSSLKYAKGGVSIRHSGDIMSKIDEARELLGITIDYYKQFESIIKGFAEVKMTKDQASLYFEDVMKEFSKSDEDGEKTARMDNKVEACNQLFINGKGNDNPDVKGTLWTAYNAVTEWSDYYRFVKGQVGNPSARVKDTLFGTGANIKNVAFDKAMAMVA